MFKHIDWLLICGYFKSYAICLISLLMLWIVVDLFTNLDDFLVLSNNSTTEVLKRISLYYAYRLPQLFDRLCEAIVLLAAMFTVAMMQRSNEQIPLLAAGVSTQRIITPILCCGCLMLTLTVVNQEFLIPKVAPKLTLGRDDPEGDKELLVKGAYEPNIIHIEGERGYRRSQTIKKFRCLIPQNIVGTMIHITAEDARYEPSKTDPSRGTWTLTGCQPRDLEPIPDILQVLDGGRYVLYTRHIDFEVLVRDQKWFLMASTQRLYQELQKPESNRLAAIAVLFHTRLVRPILGMVLLFMGLSVILLDQNRNMIISAGMCLVLCGTFFAFVMCCKTLGDEEYIAPALAAWLPVIFFGPFAFVMFDAVQT
jgi:lipopolysaccharide export system permease protein